MPYALIPDGFTLKKVNKGELEAVNRHNRALAIRRFTGSQNSSVIFIIAAAVGLYFVAKQIKIPGFNVLDSFSHAFPQLSAVFGIARKTDMTPEQKDRILSLFQEGAGPDASVLMKLFFPTPEEKAKKGKSPFQEFGI